MDVYAKAVDFFKENPDQIMKVWDDPKSHWSGVLFQAVSIDGQGRDNEEGLFCGDLCEIRSLMAHAWNLKLQEEIMNDPRLPKIFASNNFFPKITEDVLDVYAEWQRKIDKALNRSPDSFKVEE